MTDEIAEERPVPCTACRGTGSVISNLGGSPRTVVCPWCEGTRAYIRNHDAQAHWGEPPVPPAAAPRG